ncbi:MAG: flagellar hook-length control protein FliK [Natronospirillum sp.]
MLDNIISITTRNDSGTRASSVAPVRESPPAAPEDRGFSRHYKSAQAEVQSQSSQPVEPQRPSKRTSDVMESGKNIPSAHAPAQPATGKKLPPDSRDAEIVNDQTVEQISEDADAADVLAGVQISIEVVQESETPVDTPLNNLELSEEGEEALLSVLTEMFPGVEGMPESILDALRNGGFARLRELVLADIERQSGLDSGAEVSLDGGALGMPEDVEGDVEGAALSALLAALDTFAAEQGLDETTTAANASDEVSTDTGVWNTVADDQRTLLTQWVTKLIGDPSEVVSGQSSDIDSDGVDLAEESGKPNALAELLEADQISDVDTVIDVDNDRATSPTTESTPEESGETEEQVPSALNALASSANEGSDEPGEEGLVARKPGSESSSPNTTNSSNTASTNSAANNATANTLVTDETTLVRQPMEAAAVRESVARQDTEALIKQHLERELPVRNSATEVTQRLTERLVMMVSRDIQTATIRLDPPDLGKLDIRITTTNEQVQVQVVTHQPVVRDLLEQHAHRLREMLEQQGFAKVDVNVSDQSQQDRERASKESGSGGSSDQGEDGENIVVADNVRRSVGLVDHYV